MHRIFRSLLAYTLSQAQKSERGVFWVAIVFHPALVNPVDNLPPALGNASQNNLNVLSRVSRALRQRIRYRHLLGTEDQLYVCCACWERPRQSSLQSNRISRWRRGFGLYCADGWIEYHHWSRRFCRTESIYAPQNYASVFSFSQQASPQPACSGSTSEVTQLEIIPAYTQRSISCTVLVCPLRRKSCQWFEQTQRRTTPQTYS